jgi:hypothetical protein
MWKFKSLNSYAPFPRYEEHAAGVNVVEDKAVLGRRRRSAVVLRKYPKTDGDDSQSQGLVGLS